MSHLLRFRVTLNNNVRGLPYLRPIVVFGGCKWADMTAVIVKHIKLAEAHVKIETISIVHAVGVQDLCSGRLKLAANVMPSLECLYVSCGVCDSYE